MIDEIVTPAVDAPLAELADGVFVARGAEAQWTVEPSSHRALMRLLDCDYPRWRDARSEDARVRLAATRYFAKSMVARVADASVDDVELRRGAGGRPRFVFRGAARHCAPRVVDANLSHTRDAMVMAVSTRGRVGVDVEAHDRELDRGDFARAVCHRDELRDYHGRRPAERNRLLLELWTWKEASTKAMGTGLATPFPSLRANTRDGTVTDERGMRWRIHAVSGGGYRVAVASEAA